MALELPALWNKYVPEHLLPRLYGFELMMAPYAISHMKIGLKLYETGYTFGNEKRAHIYLTNSLEPSSDITPEIEGLFGALADEAKLVNAIKREKRFTIIVGNPPYAGISSNMSDYAQRIVEDYKVVDGRPLNERKLWLQDDYVKFIRTGEVSITLANYGILAYISNHGYLDNPTFRGMRQNLMQTFQRIYILDLHGNTNKKERAPNGDEDKNVFDIRQGVAIGIFLRSKKIGTSSRIFRTDLSGLSGKKEQWLNQHELLSAEWNEITPLSPFYLFAYQSQENRTDYEKGWKITEIMPLTSTGFITARDHF
ncbi:MAG TPA: DNA methyltransferase, partial [Nitrospiraceae bacterium]|nr:DNA methyltransferase [Nitrospiraceae bacterium]